MPRLALDHELNELHMDLAALSARVETIMQDTNNALQLHDKEKAKQIFSRDNEVNRAENQIEQQCVTLIALQSPLASDLRDITATLKMVTDIERVADQCADICEIMATYPEFNYMETPAGIFLMFDRAKEMFSLAVDAFIRKDTIQGTQVIGMDDEVDSLFSESIMELSGVLANDKTMISQATDYMFVAKYLERIADHAVNIAEWTIYAVTGQHKNMPMKILGKHAPLQMLPDQTSDRTVD